MAYFANGTEGFILDAQCNRCLLPDDSPCPILFVQMEFNYEQCNDERMERLMNMLVSESGECQMFKILKGMKRRKR